MDNKDIDFVASRYREHRFSADAGWRRLGIASASPWKRFRAAAAVAGVIVLSATAALIYRQYDIDGSRQTEVQAPAVGGLTVVKTIDFENAPLTQVVEKIEAVYDVKVENLPDKPDDYRLSLHYEGTATDLVDTVNDILGTDMTVVEP